jgi:hypothetical protein
MVAAAIRRLHHPLFFCLNIFFLKILVFYFLRSILGFKKSFVVVCFEMCVSAGGTSENLFG